MGHFIEYLLIILGLESSADIIFFYQDDEIWTIILLTMNSCKKVLLLVLLATLTLAQTNFNNSCQTDSMLPLLATGVVNLNPLDTYNAGANKDFYRDLSSAQFQTTDVLGYGFALSGFQANCGQAYYTLIVDQVQF